MTQLLAALLAAASLQARPALSLGLDFDGASSAAATLPEAPAAPLPARPAEKEWTVMVYMNAKNSLEDHGLDAVNRMESAGSTDKVNIVVELGRMKGYSAEDGNWTGSRRYLLKRDSAPRAITSPVLASFPSADMGDFRHLADFGRWAKENFPARRYLLVVRNGDGWKSLSYDEETYNRITVPQLREALSRIGKVDVFAADGSMTQMAGVAYEIRNYADYIVASEETGPGEGYPYDLFLSRLIYEPEMKPEALSAEITEAFWHYYDQYGEPSTQSVLRTAALPRLLQLANAWTAAVTAAGETALVKRAKAGAQAYVYADNKDLYDLVRLVREGTGDPAVEKASAALMDLISGELVAYNRFVDDEMAGSHGIAVYLPVYRYNPAYGDLAWAGDSGWDEFAQWTLKLK